MPVSFGADSDGWTVPGEYLVEAGYALTGGDGCIAEARHLALTVLDRVRDELHLSVPAQAMDFTRLVVSELVTNARKYAPGPVLMELRVTTAFVEVVVWDSDPTVPAARVADPERVGQHGLEIVMAVANVCIRTAPVGKRITARIALPDSSR
jgi:hypothetical protein